MKKRIFNYLALVLCFSLVFSACKKDEGPGTEIGPIIEDLTINGESFKKIAGNVEQDYTLSSDFKWLLSGGVFVKSGYTLNIDAGTQIYAADDGTVPFLSIEQGAKINADGTASSPIVFTSQKALGTDADSGDWGGIIINGYGVINTGETAEGEGGTGIYGGNNNADNSGTLRYVRVEYAGKILGTDNELNGFSFNGVGSGTTVEYIQAYKGSDDGIEFFGGAVNVKYAVSTGNQDDSFDWTHGWSGKGQFWVVQQGENGGDRGIEADNNGDDNEITPFSNPTIANITLVGFDDGDGKNQGMKLREGTKAKIYNAIVTGFPKRGVQVEHNQTLLNMTDESLSLSNSVIDNIDPFVYTNSDGTEASPTNSWEMLPTNSTDAVSLSAYIGSVTNNAADASTLDSWFDSAPFIGAVKDSNSDWTSGWTRSL